MGAETVKLLNMRQQGVLLTKDFHLRRRALSTALLSLSVTSATAFAGDDVLDCYNAAGMRTTPAASGR